MSEKNRSARWWAEDERKRADALVSVFQRIRKNDEPRVNRYLKWARLYGNREIRALSSSAWHRTGSDARLKYNAIRSAVNTFVSKVGKQRPRPLVLTRDGDYSLRKRAKKMTAFFEGVYHATRFYQQLPIICRDGGVFGTGPVKIFEDGPRKDEKGKVLRHGHVCIERTYPWELFVDAVEGFYGDPPSMYQVKCIDRSRLLELFPEEERAIEKAATAPKREGYVQDSVADQLEVIEAWHLPSGPDAEDGRHTIAIEGAALLDEEWKRRRFPFSFYRYDAPLAGFWGDGLVDDIVPAQFELNLSLDTLQRCLRIAGVPRLFLERGSRVVKSHFTNEIGEIIEYTGTKPVQEVAASVPPELFAHIAQLKMDIVEQPGMNQLSASGRKPAGIESGKALREHNDIETERFSTQSRGLEEFGMDVAEQVVELVREISERDGGYRVKAFGSKSMEVIDWSDVELDEDVYVMRVYPVSLLSTHPTAKLEQVQELVATNFMSREDAMRLLDYPDLESVQSLELAAYEIVDSAIEKMIEEEVYVSPEPYFPLDWAARRVQSAYLKAKLDGVKEGGLELLRRFIDDCQAMQLQAQQAAAPAAPAAAAIPADPAGAAPPMAPDAAAAPPALPPAAAA